MTSGASSVTFPETSQGTAMTFTNAQYLLITNGTATGNAVEWRGGRGTFAVVGTFSGATVKLQVLGPDGVTWLDVGAECTLTAPGIGGFELGNGSIRAAVSAGPPTGIYASAVAI